MSCWAERPEDSIPEEMEQALMMLVLSEQPVEESAAPEQPLTP